MAKQKELPIADIPTFKDEVGKTIIKRTLLNPLFGAVYGDRTICRGGGYTMKILSNVRDDKQWTIEVRLEKIR